MQNKNRKNFRIWFFFKTKAKKNETKISKFLVTNSHVITEEDINNNQIIEINIEYNNIKREIELDSEKRFIRSFPKPIDITIIEILETDDLKEKIKFLKRDYSEEGYINRDIYIFHHPKGEDAACSRGKILNIDGYTFIHNAFTTNGSSGSAIILADDDNLKLKLIGIHCKKNTINNLNYGVFIEEIIDKLYLPKSNIISEIKEDNINKIINLNSAPPTKIFQLIILRYKKFNENFIRIFGDIFVKNNMDNCKIIVENKVYKLCNKMPINKMKKIDNNKYEIKLKITNDLIDLSYMFCHCDLLLSSSEINKIDISKSNNISYLFSECQYLSEIPDISKWNTCNIENIACLFAGCQSLSYIPDISKWNTSNVKNMMGVFAGCTYISSLPDISKWNTNKVTKMDFLFFRCDSLKEIPDISKWDTKNVINMSHMFYNCATISYLPDLSKWNTSNVKYIEFMFANCVKLTSFPNFSSWDTRKIVSMKSLFSNICLKKEKIKFPKAIVKNKKDNNNHHQINKNYFQNLLNEKKSS